MNDLELMYLLEENGYEPNIENLMILKENLYNNEKNRKNLKSLAESLLIENIKNNITVELNELNESILNEGKLFNNIRWKLALFSLKFLSDQTLNDFFNAYYSNKPKKLKEINSLPRKEKIKRLRKIANEKITAEQREKIANSEVAKKCEKAATISGISTAISGLTTTFAVARAANATGQYLASKAERDANDNMPTQITKEKDDDPAPDKGTLVHIFGENGFKYYQKTDGVYIKGVVDTSDLKQDDIDIPTRAGIMKNVTSFEDFANDQINDNTAGGFSSRSNGFVNFANVNAKDIVNINKFYTYDKNNGYTEIKDFNSFNSYVDKLDGKVWTADDGNGNTRVITTAICNSGVEGEIIVNDKNEIILIKELGENYKLPEGNYKLADNSWVDDYTITADNRLVKTPTLKEAMSEEKKENIKTGIQLFLSAISALAMIIFPAICGAAGVAIASGVIAGSAAVNTGFGVARTKKMAHKATVLRRNEILKQLMSPEGKTSTNLRNVPTQTTQPKKDIIKESFSDYELYQILEENGYTTTKQNLEILKEGLISGRYKISNDEI